MTPRAAYDEIADWYEREFLAGQRAGGGRSGADPLGIDRALEDLLGRGGGICLEVGCGTGVRAGRVRELGWTPVGVDLSAGMLRHARGRLVVAQADAERLPIRDAAVPAAIAVMVHTDMPAYPAVLGEVARVLRPGGVLVHVGASLLLRRVRRPQRRRGGGDRSRLSRRSLDQGVLDRPGSSPQGGRRPPPAARPAPCVPRRGPDAGTVRRGRHAHPGRPGRQSAQTSTRRRNSVTPSTAVLTSRGANRCHDDSAGSLPPRPSAAATTHAADLRCRREPEAPTLRRWRPGRVGSPPRRR
jgi:SAM-dependent methyltransferase